MVVLCEITGVSCSWGNFSGEKDQIMGGIDIS